LSKERKIIRSKGSQEGEKERGSDPQEEGTALFFFKEVFLC